MANIEQVKYLIIGNSAGGIGAVEAIREMDKVSPITIVSDEPYPAYSRPLISEYLSSGYTLEKMLFRPSGFYQKYNISTRLGKKVEKLDIDEHTVRLEDGHTIGWSKLLLATGGVPIVPPFKGSDRKGIFTFTTLDDARAIEQFLIQLRNRDAVAVIIGGGLIGVSAAEALVKLGVKVTLIEMKERILNIIIDEEGSSLEEEALQKAGVNIITGNTVAEVGSYTEGAVNSVELEDGTLIPCNLVVVAIGVRPRTELAAQGGIEVNRGIVVDSHMATSHPDVYACGDAAEAYDFVHDRCQLTPIWPNAYVGGRTAGLNMTGAMTEYPGGTSMNSLKYFGLNVVSAGITTPPDESYEVLSIKQGTNYRKVVLKDNIVVGLVFAGYIEKSGIIFNLMKNKINAEGFKSSLIREDFGLSSLPEELWRQHLEAPARDLVKVT